MGLELASEADSEDQKPCGENEKFYTEGQQIYNIVQDIRQSAQGGQCVPHLPESVNEAGQVSLFTRRMAMDAATKIRSSIVHTQ